MRRHSLALAIAAGLVLSGVAAAQDGTSALGASGELYRVESGTYKSLFPATAPADLAANPVLALDIVRAGKLQRILVPGTDDSDREASPALTVDPTTNRVYLVWQGVFNIHPVLNLIGYGADGWGEVFEFAGDAFSFKSNPQLAATVDHYQVLDENGNPVAANRTILHLAWYDSGGLGERVLYTPIVIEDGSLQRTNRIFDLQQLATGQAASGTALPGLPTSLFLKPQVRAGSDGGTVVIGFVAPSTGNLVSLELRSVTGELVSFADDARAQVIETGRSNPGLSPGDIVAKARAQVIETGRKLLRPEVADYLAQSFLSNIAGADPAQDLGSAIDKARAQVIETGVALTRGVAQKSGSSQVLEIGDSDGLSSEHLLDVRAAADRSLPTLPSSDLRLFLSAHGDNAAIAWSTATSVLYRETTTTDPSGWGPQRTLGLGPSLTLDDAFALVAQRTSPR